jgi:hypothetical protein
MGPNIDAIERINAGSIIQEPLRKLIFT